MAILHFQEAVRQHHHWFEELIACLRGETCELFVDHIGEFDKCVIGDWLHGEGETFAHLEPYQNVVRFHKQVHEIAAEAWSAKVDDNHHRLEELLKHLDEIKHNMFMAWRDLNLVIGALE